MIKKIKRIINCCIRAYREFAEADMYVYSANAALFLEIAAFPLMILLLSILRYFPLLKAEQLQTSLMELFPEVPEISSTVLGIASELERESTAAVSWLSGLTALFSASSGVLAVIKGLTRMYNINSNSWMKYRLISMAYTAALLLIIILALGTQLSAKLIIGLLNSSMELPELRRFADNIFIVLKYFKVITTAAIFLAVLELYRFPFGQNRKLRDRLPGAVFTAVSCFLASKVFTFAIGRFWKPSIIYGSLTAVILLAYWGYTIMIILFMGAALNKVVPERSNT